MPGPFLPVPSPEWAALHPYVVKEITYRTNHRVWGHFKLSDGSVTHWDYRWGQTWHDWNTKSPSNVVITRQRIKIILQEASQAHAFKVVPSASDFRPRAVKEDVTAEDLDTQISSVSSVSSGGTDESVEPSVQA